VRKTVETLGNAGTRVVVLRDGPVHKTYLDKCVARALWQKRDTAVCDTPRGEALEQTIPDAEKAAIAGIGNATYIDVTNFFCNATTCPAMIDGKLTFRDRHHIATPFAATLAAPLQRAIFGETSLSALKN
jgi:hypothetical protein